VLRILSVAAAVCVCATTVVGGEWVDTANAVVIRCTQARDQAERLPILTPWPAYEVLRENARERGRSATDRAAVALLFANSADGWATMVTRCRAAGDVAGANDAAIAYQRSATRCQQILEEADEQASICRSLATQCQILLDSL
jgi:hypothetical protein